MAITRRGFFAFAPAAFFAMREMFGQQAPQTPAQIPAADPDLQDELDETLRAVLRNPAQADQALSPIVDGIFDRITAALPEAKILPSKPNIFVYDGRQINVGNAMEVERGKHASALTVTRLARTECSLNELRYAMAHEIAHMLINLNKNLLADYRLPDTHAVRKDLKELGITDTNSEGYKAYKTEMLADRIAILLTEDVGSMASMLSKSKASHLNATNQQADLEEQKVIAALEAQGKRISERSKRRMFSHHRTDYNRKVNRSDPHPKEEIRVKAAREVESQLRKRNRQNARPQSPAPN